MVINIERVKFMPIDPVILTQDLVRCPSITPADAGALEVMSTALRPMGFHAEHLRFQEEGTDAVDNVFARRGTTGRHLCYLGHTDVVPVGRESDWTYPPFAAEIHDGKLYGRGTADMKAGNAAFVAAVSRFLSRHADFEESISLLITGDEEALAVNGTVKVIEWMQQNGQLPNVALVGEPGNPERLGQVMRVGRRGSWNAKIVIEGKQGHSAYPERADNPIPKLIQILQHVLAEKLDDGTDYCPPSHIVISSVDVGNPASNVIPARAEALINIRFNDIWTDETIDSHMREVFSRAGIPFHAHSWCNAKSFMGGHDEIWRELVADAVEHVSGTRPAFDTGGGTSDARFIAPFCPVVEYGPVNATIHQVDEFCSVADIEALTRTYDMVLEKYFYGNP